MNFKEEYKKAQAALLEDVEAVGKKTGEGAIQDLNKANQSEVYRFECYSEGIFNYINEAATALSMMGCEEASNNLTFIHKQEAEREYIKSVLEFKQLLADQKDKLSEFPSSLITTSFTETFLGLINLDAENITFNITSDNSIFFNITTDPHTFDGCSRL